MPRSLGHTPFLRFFSVLQSWWGARIYLRLSEGLSSRQGAGLRWRPAPWLCRWPQGLAWPLRSCWLTGRLEPGRQERAGSPSFPSRDMAMVSVAVWVVSSALSCLGGAVQEVKMSSPEHYTHSRITLWNWVDPASPSVPCPSVFPQPCAGPWGEAVTAVPQECGGKWSPSCRWPCLSLHDCQGETWTSSSVCTHWVFSYY